MRVALAVVLLSVSQEACIAHEPAVIGKEEPSAEQHPVPSADGGSPPAAVVPVPPPAARIRSGKVAVLDLKSTAKDLGPDDVRYFGDLVRGATLKAAPQLEVMPRENLLALLQSTGKDPAHCPSECEVDLGRRIGADAIVSGEALKVGTRFKLTLRLHETHEGKLLGAAVASGHSIDELDASVTKAVGQLFRGE